MQVDMGCIEACPPDVLVLGAGVGKFVLLISGNVEMIAPSKGVRIQLWPLVSKRYCCSIMLAKTGPSKSTRQLSSLMVPSKLVPLSIALNSRRVKIEQVVIAMNEFCVQCASRLNS